MRAETVHRSWQSRAVATREKTWELLRCQSQARLAVVAVDVVCAVPLSPRSRLQAFVSSIDARGLQEMVGCFRDPDVSSFLHLFVVQVENWNRCFRELAS